MINLTDSIIKSSMYGFIIGDVLGVPVEFSKREYLENNPITDMIENKGRRTTIGYWSDDTAMTLCGMQSIIDKDKVDYTDLLDKYLMWLETGYMAIDNKCFGIGQTTFRSLLNYKKSKNYIEYMMKNNPTSEKNGGNGAMMRILPIILYLYKQDEQLARKYDVIEGCTNITHDSRVNIEACVFYAMFIFNLINSHDLQRSYDEAIEQHLEYYAGCQSLSLDRILLNKLIMLDKSEIKSTGYVVNTLEASLWCLFNTNSYEEAVLTAVNLGGDTDTIAAITGSMAGIYYGLDSIPKKWIDKIQDKERIDEITDRFIKLLIEQ